MRKCISDRILRSSITNAADILRLQRHELAEPQGPRHPVAPYPHPLQPHHLEASVANDCADLHGILMQSCTLSQAQDVAAPEDDQVLQPDQGPASTLQTETLFTTHCMHAATAAALQLAAMPATLTKG